MFAQNEIFTTVKSLTYVSFRERAERTILYIITS